MQWLQFGYCSYGWIGWKEKLIYISVLKISLIKFYDRGNRGATSPVIQGLILKKRISVQAAGESGIQTAGLLVRKIRRYIKAVSRYRDVGRSAGAVVTELSPPSERLSGLVWPDNCSLD